MEIEAYAPLPKSALQHGFGVLLSEKPPACRQWPNSTSGSTGRPTNVVVDSVSHTWRTATGWRGDCFGGFRPTDRQMIFWGLRREKRGPLKAWLADHFFNRVTNSIFVMDEARVLKMHQHLCAFRPRILTGYVSGLCAFAEIATKLGLRPPALEKVIPTAEYCSPRQLEGIRAYFGAPTMLRYGAVEVGDLAHQCEQGHWHIHSEHVYLEVKREDGSIARSGSGNLLVTLLSNYTMPLVRYELGDYVDLTAQPCSCGRGLPTLTDVHGRAAESILAADGSRFSSLAFTHSLRKFPLRQFRIVQESLEEVHVLFIPLPECTEAMLAALTGELLAFLQGKLQLSMERVERIDPLPNGKQSHVLNKLNPQWREIGIQ